MSETKAYEKAARLSREKRSTRYVVYDGEDFGADNVGQGGYQVASEEDIDGFYNGCTLVACFENGELAFNTEF